MKSAKFEDSTNLYLCGVFWIDFLSKSAVSSAISATFSASSNRSNKESCFGSAAFFTVGVGALSEYLEIRDLNSNSWNKPNNSFMFGSLTNSSSSLSSIGVSVLIVARKRENLICSTLLSTLVFKAPLSLSVLASRFSMLPNSCRSFTAVFSPTPGQPGMLSLLSPIRPSRSITCS